MKCWKRIAALLLVLIMITVSAAANSTERSWDGTEASGAMIQDGNSPILVEQELLTFDIQQFPKHYLDDVDLKKFLDYEGAVTAEYTFYNPAEYGVTATLLFPFGCKPMYLSDRHYGKDVDKYQILVNGTAIERTLRHTFSERFSQFDLERDLALLHDDCVTDSFYTPDTPVTKYVFVPSGVDMETYRAATVGFDMEWEDPLRRIYFVDQTGGQTPEEGMLRVSTQVENGIPLTVYVIGQDYAAFPQWKFYENGGVEDLNEMEGTMQLESREEMTFWDLAMSQWDEETGVSQIDWYNARVAMWTDPSYGSGSNVILWSDLDLRDYLMRWYEYEIHLEPGERIVNTVTAPIYPSINEHYDPPVYSYTYLLSPAQTWAEFGTLDIVVNTPFCMTQSNLDGFQQNETGYACHLDGLPEGELTFDLCAEPMPAWASNGGDRYQWGLLVLMFAALLIGGLVVIMRKNNEEIQSQ